MAEKKKEREKSLAKIKYLQEIMHPVPVITTIRQVIVSSFFTFSFCLDGRNKKENKTIHFRNETSKQQDTVFHVSSILLQSN